MKKIDWENSQIRTLFAAVLIFATPVLLAAGFCFVVLYGVAHNAKGDPNWQFYNFETQSLTEIEAFCGTDWLLDRFASLQADHTYYQLSISQKNAFENPDCWESLYVSVNYGESRFDTKASQISYYLYFDPDKRNPSFEEFMEQYPTETLETGEHTVTFIEWSNEDAESFGSSLSADSEYHAWALFTHNGVTCHLETSSQDPDFFETTLEHIL